MNGIHTLTRGNKQFELCNNLGNVLATIQDRKRSVDLNADNVADYYMPYLRTVTNYYAFGSAMPGIGGSVKECSVSSSGENGITRPNDSGLTVNVIYRPGYIEALIHENRHCIGILLHELGPNNDGYDFQDEKNAYEDQNIYYPSSVSETINGDKLDQYKDNPNKPNDYSLEDAIKYLYNDSKAKHEFIDYKSMTSRYPLLKLP